MAAVAILLAAGAAAYSNSFHAPFILDDLQLIPENPALRGPGAPGSPWHLAFSSNFRTRPVIALTVAMNYVIGGLDVRGYHAANLLIHLLAALALFGAGRRLVHRRTVSRRHWPGGAGRCILRPSGTHPEPAGALKKAGTFQAEHTDGGDLSRWGIATRARAMPRKVRRRLIWIPIIHTQADLGNMAESVKSLYVRKMGRAKWEKHVADIDRMWRGIRARIEKRRLDYARVRLYQDGLPTCGHEEQIVRDLARAGSQNHQLLADLMERGATIMGTESPELLLEEYNLAREALVASGGRESPEAAARRGSLGKAILEKRDRYIGARIAETLQPGETGLAFLGMLHAPAGRLPPDIEVIR